MSSPGNHHHLPEFYSKAWCQPNGKLAVYTKLTNGKVALSELAPKYTGFEPHLYALPQAPVDKKAVIESEFMNPAIDGPASIAIEKIRARNMDDFSAADRSAFARFLMSMRLRTPEIVEELRNAPPLLLKKELETIEDQYTQLRQDNDPATLIEWVEKNRPNLIPNFGMQMLPKLINNSDMGEKIYELDWWMEDVSKTNRELFISDRPLVMLGGQEQKHWYFMLPIAPQLLFVAAKDGNFGRLQMKKLGMINIVKHMNAAVVQQAKERVYSASPNHKLSYLEKRIGSNWPPVKTSLFSTT